MDARPLAITADEELFEELQRVAAAAGVELTRLTGPDSRSAWRMAPLVLVDAQQVTDAVRAGMSRRSGVVMVTDREPDLEVWEQCVVLGVERSIVLPHAADELVDLLADALDSGPGGGRVVAVVGAGGGAGASVLSAAVAVAGVRAGLGVLLADCDPWGGGLDVLLGLEADPGLRWTDLSAPSGRVPVDALHEALPSIHRTGVRRRTRDPALRRGVNPALSVLASYRSPETEIPSAETLAVLLDACRRAGELAVLDVPRQPYPAAEQALDAADLVVLVACADVRSCYSARVVADRLLDRAVPVGLVVRGPSPGGLGGDDLADALDLPLIAQMRPQPQLARDLEWGRAPGTVERSPLARAADKVVAAVSGSRP